MSIGLALSGGGFRATLFHLGVIDALRTTYNSKCQTVLSRVREITGVSGGSVLAAYLVLKWHDINGSDAISQKNYECFRNDIIRLTQRDVRNRVLRRICLRQLLVLPWLLLPSWRSASLLEREYRDSLFQDFCMQNLPNGAPFLSLLSTSLTTGQIVAFETDGVRFDPVARGQFPFSPTTGIRLARAVAASAGFPPLSSPVRLFSDELGLYPPYGLDHELTDGGVFDNLGAIWLGLASSQRMNKNQLKPLDYLLLSDAGIPFKWASPQKYHQKTGYLKRNIRANDIQMDRLADYDWRQVKRSGGIKDSREFRIGNRYSPTLGLSWAQQHRAAQIATDLNRIQDDDVELLIQHGKNAALAVLNVKPIP